MKIPKQVLRPERLRQVPEQFSWVDQALVRCGFIDRCDARATALYLFLVTVADSQGRGGRTIVSDYVQRIRPRCEANSW